MALLCVVLIVYLYLAAEMRNPYQIYFTIIKVLKSALKRSYRRTVKHKTS